LAEARRTEDRLREKYFQLLPEIRRVAGQLQAQINYHVLPIANALEPYEQLIVKSRVKECESAVDALRRRQEGASFDNDQPARYTLANLKDLAGVRILVFPRQRIIQVDRALRKIFGSWTADPVAAEEQVLAFEIPRILCGESTNQRRVSNRSHVDRAFLGNRTFRHL
jgi:ppGpp synthetase/RelA/SpoT-type nucleotidyltranferase